MDIGTLTTTPMATAPVSRQGPAALETQMTLVREVAESQQQIAQMIAETGLGQRIDVHA